MPRTPELASAYIERSLSKIDSLIDTHKDKVIALREELSGLMALTATAFPKEGELYKLEAELKEIEFKINAMDNPHEKEKGNSMEM